MTYAENTMQTRERDDEHMIYEMFNLSQYEDGSVLDCIPMRSYTAKQVVDGECDSLKTAKNIIDDLKRNALAAIKHGNTMNLAPRV